MVWLVAVGLVTLLGQVVLLREVLVTFFGSELICLLSLGLLMLGTAAGAYAGRWSRRASPAQVRVLLLVFAALVPSLAALARVLRPLLGATTGAYLPFSQQFLGMAFICVPFGLAGGLLFQAAARLAVESGATLARAYAVESAGGLLGGALSTGLLATGIQNFSAALLCGLAAAGAASSSAGGGRSRGITAAGLSLAFLLTAGLAFSHPLDLALSRVDQPLVVDTLDTPYGRAALARAQDQVVVYENGALAWESQGTSAEEFVHLAALQVKGLERVLVLSGAVEDLAGELLKHAPRRVVDVELDRRLIDRIKPRLPAEAQAALSDPRVEIVFTDPRRFLGTPETYDLILSGAPEPDSGQANRFYTREFFELCRRRLNPGGVLAFRLRSAENLWTSALARRTASIHRAAEAVFEDILVLPGTTNVVLASDSSLVRDPDVLAARLAERGIHARLVSPPYLRYILTNDRLAEIRDRLAHTDAPENTDARPVCYPFTLVFWLSRFFPRLGTAEWPDIGPRSPSLWGGVAAAALLCLLARRSTVLRRMTLVVVAGFSGMLLEGAILLAYQTRQGVLYQDLGLLLTLFMGGLALGSLWVLRAARGGLPGEGAPRWGGVLLALATAGAALLSAGAFLKGFGGSLWLAGPLLALSGSATGGLFGYASLRRVDDQGAAVSPLYAADLLGGCLGALLGSLFLLPFLGLPVSALLVAVLALVLLILV